MMRKAIGSVAMSLAVLAMSGGGVQADSVEELQKQIHEKVSKLTSFSYKMKMTSETNDANFQTKTESMADVEYMKKGDKTLYRTEMSTKMVMKLQTGEQTTDTKTMSVFDGEYSYTYSESNGNKQAMKQKYDPTVQSDPFDQMKLFKEQGKNYSFKVLPDETIDGKPCWVLEMTPKDEQMKAYIGKMIAYYDKGTGITLKSVSFDGKGKATGTTIISNVKTNETIPPDHFKFTPPAGVEVKDMTKGG